MPLVRPYSCFDYEKWPFNTMRNRITTTTTQQTATATETEETQFMGADDCSDDPRNQNK